MHHNLNSNPVISRLMCSSVNTVAVITLKTVHHMQIRIKVLVLYYVDMVIKTVLKMYNCLLVEILMRALLSQVWSTSIIHLSYLLLF